MQNLIFTLSKFGYKFSNNWKEFWSKREILKKGIYTSILLIIFVLGTTITAPFIKVANINQINDNSFLNTLNLIGGGGLRQFSLFALGISPFINASLIMMILQSKLVPPIYKMSQSGPQGRKNKCYYKICNINNSLSASSFSYKIFIKRKSKIKLHTNSRYWCFFRKYNCLFLGSNDINCRFIICFIYFWANNK